MSRDDDFLARWSRRKRAPQPEAETAPPAEAPSPEVEKTEAETAPPAEAPSPEVEKTEAEVLEELGLPDPDTLGRGDDFKAFMAKAVPDYLRRRALRRLWGTNPALANLDELLEYGEDYTDKATVLANVQSAYQAGRGYLDRLPKEPEAAETVEETAEAEAPSGTPEEEADQPEEEAVVEEAAGAEGLAGAGEEEIAVAPLRRRMRFTFDEG